ncbi:MAG: hypothetical protein ACYCXW_18295 [Solirubrobacteraceae bacterium]
MSRRQRFAAALAGEVPAFAPILWERLPELVRQPRSAWWSDPTVGQRMIADAAAIALADAMFTFTAHEAVRSALAAGASGDGAIDALASGDAAIRGAELVACVHEVADHAVVPVLPPPPVLCRDLGGDEPEPAEDAFSDLALGFLRAGADALAVHGSDADEVGAAVARAAAVGELFGRPVLGICEVDGSVHGWVHGGGELGVASVAGEWPDRSRGVVITPGDVSGRWSAEQLRTLGGGRP